MAVTRNRLSFDKEKQILVNLILDTTYCERVLHSVKPDYFRSSYAKILIGWILNYYKNYNKAPRFHITDIYENERDYMDPEVAIQLGSILEHLSDIAETENPNTDYLVDAAVNFFEERHLTLQVEAAQHYLTNGDVSQAREAINKKFELVGTKTDWIDFSSDENIRECVRLMVEQSDLNSAFFAFDGRLGEFIGPIDRGWFVAFLAPAKRGKTTYLMETIVTAIRRRLNVVVLSLEMPVNQLYRRYMLYTVGDKPEAGERLVMTPIMDCYSNQTGNCDLEQRKGFGAITQLDGTTLTFDNAPDWVPCTECRGKKEFKPTSWKVPIEKKNYTEGEYIEKVNKFSKYYGKYCRAIHIPSKSMTVEELQAEVKVLEYTQNFIPDVIVIDYADLIRPEGGGGQKRHDLDDIWEGLRAWGQTSKVLMVSASQTNRISADAKYLKDTHVAEDYSKIAKLDVGIGLCQTDEMKLAGLMNINKVVHRHSEYLQSHVCTVLQELSHQQPVLDSEFIVI
jgi:replicative DNA helicase